MRVGDGSLVVKRKDERGIEPLPKIGNSRFSPASPEGPEEQFTYGDERKSRGSPFDVAEIWQTTPIAGLHQIGENVRVEQDDVERIADQS